jgi:acyl-CoA synthetase (AMP-forming)/AMP-acid ligase II
MNAMAELIARAGRQFGEREAVVGAERTLSFREVDAESNRLASCLSRVLGLAKGERVAILLANCPAFVIADFALIKAGLVRVPVNPRYAGPEIEFILNHSGAAAVVTSAAFAGVVATIAAPALRCVINVEPDTALPGTVGWRDSLASALSWRDALAAGSADPFVVDTAAGDHYMLAYTSGTTGRPKGALTTVGARSASIFICYANEMFVTPDDVMLHVASLAHGSGTKVLPLFAKGAAQVLLSKFSAPEFFRLVEKHRVTISWMVPTMVAMLADAPERERFDTSSLTTVIYGGATMPEPVLARALAAFGPVFVQIYGLTEAPHPDLVLAKHEHLPDPATGVLKAAGATGRAAIGAQIRLVDDSGRDVSPGDVGEIIIAGDHVMAGYWNDPAATAETLRDGWCHTGDMARVDAAGLYTIVDRKKEMIISGGYNVYPREVEDALYRHSGVAECAVIGAPDETWGETVHALIVAKPGKAIDAESLLAHCARELAGYKKPRKLTFVEALPRTANGKIDKKALRARFVDAVVPAQAGTHGLPPSDDGSRLSPGRHAGKVTV